MCTLHHMTTNLDYSVEWNEHSYLMFKFSLIHLLKYHICVILTPSFP